MREPSLVWGGAGSAFYERCLLQNVLPYWLEHGPDAEGGGIHNMLADDGTVLGHDKYLWSQGRALWTFAALCNRLGPRPEWRAMADAVYAYLSSRGRDEMGHWMFLLDGGDNVLQGCTSICVDGFVMNGMGEYYRLSGEDRARQLAEEAYTSIAARLAVPGSYGTAPYEIPSGLKTHGVAMIFSLFFYNLGEVLERPDIRAHGLSLAHEVLDHFYIPGRNAILEFVTLEGQYVDTPQGRSCVPGHALEALWFLISIFRRSGNEDRIPLCCHLIKRHVELAWDAESGGCRLALDIAGQSPVYWKNATYKPWWVQVEALVATAAAHLHCGEPWCLEWHEKIKEWAFAHYPHPAGEWTQWLDGRGRPITSNLLPVKDAFHLPRALLELTELFRQIEGKPHEFHQRATD